MGFEDALRSVALPLLRFGGAAAHALLLGIPAILVWVIRPMLGAYDGDETAARVRVGARLEGMVRAALIASLVTTSLFLLVQATVVSELRRADIDGGAFASVFETSFGRWYLLRYPMLAALAVLVVGRVSRSTARGAEGKARLLWLSLWAVLAVGLTATSTFSGHAMVSSPRLLAVTNDVIHLVSGGIWFTGVVLLAVVLPDAWAHGHGGVRSLQMLAPAVDRFARVAAVSIAVVGVTGVLNSVFNLQSPADLVSSPYGRAVAGKMALFIAILGLGGINHYVVRRRLNAAVVAGRDDGARLVFRRTIAVELAIAVAVMAITGYLVGSARTRPSAAPTGISVPAASF